MLEVIKDVRKAFVGFRRRDGQSRADAFLRLQSQTDDDRVEQLFSFSSERLDHEIAESVGVNECHFGEIITASEVVGLGNALEIKKTKQNKTKRNRLSISNHFKCRRKNLMIYLDEIATVALGEIAFVDARGGRMPAGAALAIVQVLGFGDLVDGLALANGIE